MAAPTSQPPSSRIYKPLILDIYDLWVLKLSNTRAWQCPTTTVQQPFFQTNIGARHLDIGVGTGYYPASVVADNGKDRKVKALTLVDLNGNALEKAKARVNKLGFENVKCVVGDVLKELDLWEEREGDEGTKTPAEFDSISLMYLFHCLSGPPASKLSAFSLVKKHLAPTGVLFGTTILGLSTEGAEVKHNLFGKALMWLYNGLGVFGNYEDGKEDFEVALRENFGKVEVEVVGKVLMFRAWAPIY